MARMVIRLRLPFLMMFRSDMVSHISMRTSCSFSHDSLLPSHRQPLLLHYFPIIYPYHPLHLVDQPLVVGGEQECDAFLLVQLFHEINDGLRGPMVEVGRGLVRQDQ